MRAPLAFALTVAVLGQTIQLSDAAYYPIELGGSWTYQVQRFDKRKTEFTKVTWRVTHEDRKQSPPVYQLWPSPMRADDEAMRLRVTEAGIEDVDTKTLVLKFPLRQGTAWEASPLGGGPKRRFRMLSVAVPCSARKSRFAKCATVEETDGRDGLRTVTTYARGTGPVLYEYFRRQSDRSILVQRVQLQTIQ